MTRLRATTSSVIAMLAILALALALALALLAGAPNAGATDGEAPPSTPPTDPCDVLVDSCTPSFSAVALGDLVRSGRRARLAVVVTSREEDQGTVSHPITAVTITAIHRDGVSRTRTVSPLTRAPRVSTPVLRRPGRWDLIVVAAFEGASGPGTASSTASVRVVRR